MSPTKSKHEIPSTPVFQRKRKTDGHFCDVFDLVPSFPLISTRLNIKIVKIKNRKSIGFSLHIGSLCYMRKKPITASKQAVLRMVLKKGELGGREIMNKMNEVMKEIKGLY